MNTLACAIAASAIGTLAGFMIGALAALKESPAKRGEIAVCFFIAVALMICAIRQVC